MLGKNWIRIPIIFLLSNKMPKYTSTSGCLVTINNRDPIGAQNFVLVTRQRVLHVGKS